MEKIIGMFDFIWRIPLTLMVVIIGIYFSCCINFIQITKIKKILSKTILSLKSKGKHSYETILTVLGGTVGAGNVVGVCNSNCNRWSRIYFLDVASCFS